MYWLSVERYENWIVDRNSGFTFLGISERKQKIAEKMEIGDILVTYVSSGYSCFSDAREIVSEKPKRSKFGLIYDEPYPYFIETKPLVILHETQWVKIHKLVTSLGFLPKEKDWRQVLRNSPKKLSNADGEIILVALNNAYRQCNSTE
ncbi:hypothetical protein COW64_12260 [bacterium (Candidatus Blackallbacteria) CG18_big_fil_WC_8_21_14_2_50_49_26]|nr:MAG: hypothetical protein COW64_12260 [bacterium (Candidatus Blackallbacteria) CG18_big_fil_WC_8_21_14_2_50_49_26]